MLFDEENVVLFRQKNYNFYCAVGSPTVRLTSRPYSKAANLVMGFKPKPGFCFDHINRNPHDNRRDNLRHCTKQQNECNRAPGANNATGYKGVCFEMFTGRYLAKIQVHGVAMNLGRYDTKEEAARVYDEAAKIHHGEFAYLNFPGT